MAHVAALEAFDTALEQTGQPTVVITSARVPA
jgi:hypothetical protein